MNKIILTVASSALLIISTVGAFAGSVFLTGHDPDFHASSNVGAQNINKAAISYILDPLFNDIAADGISKFLFVEAYMSPPTGHKIGENGIIASGYTAGIQYEKHGASTLNAELDLLGTKYAGIVIASDFGGLLTQLELDILNSRTTDIFSFLNDDNGGLYAMAESGHGDGLTTGGWFDFLPFVVSSVPASQSETGTTVTAFGASLGLTNADVSSNFSHNVFNSASGLGIVDIDSQGRILSLAGRGTFDPDNGLTPVPLPASIWLLLSGFGLVGAAKRWLRKS
ncbi:MAG: hypothetical protein ACU0CA_10090 [Paracoccaceae bacterium]